MFKGVYSRKSFPETVKDGAYIASVGECKSIGTQYKTLYANGNNATCFDSC